MEARMPDSAERIIERVYAAGIVGAGGAGFPTQLKLRVKADIIIANGAECEPLLHNDQYAMINYPHYLIDGLRALTISTGAKEVFLALKAHYQPAIVALRPYIRKNPWLKLHLLSDFYPAGDEQTLVYEVTGRLVSEGGIPPQVGVLVNNVTTLVQIGYALEGKAVTSRAITVAGEVKTPQVLTVPLGARLKDVVSAAGGAKLEEFVLIKGGPMMGCLTDADDVVTKTCGGVIVLAPDHALIRQYSLSPLKQLVRARSACEVCQMCTDLCPRFLLGHNLKPHLMVRAMSYQRDDMTAYVASAFLCCQCGICDMLACPCHLSPRALYAAIKREFAHLGTKNPHHRKPPTPHPDRNGRKTSLKRLVQSLGIAAYYRLEPYYNPAPATFSTVKIKLLQHLGAPAQPIVKPGEQVAVGQVIAKPPADKPGALIHASITGKVIAVTVEHIEIEA
jgi:Na+-translocating ferredoxin:NAD+ oxidoreductase RnfC subunit